MKRSVTVLLLLLMITAPMFAQMVDGRRELVRAEYGWGNYWADVTDRVSSLIRGDSLSFRVDNETLGVDPARGKDKTLRLHLRDRQGRTQTLSFDEEKYVDVQGIYSRYQGGGYDDYDRDLRILRATYGYGSRTFDVTYRLQRQVYNDRIDLQVTNENMGGDPAVGKDKTLTVEYSVDGRRDQVVVNEGDYLRLSGSGYGSGSGNGGYGGDNRYGDLQILRASYGYGDRYIDVTDRLQRQVYNDRIDLQVTNENMGGDPAVGKDKTLTVEYSLDGRRDRVAVREGDYLRLAGSGVGGGYDNGNNYGDLRIERATYGYGSRSFDVTDRLQRQVYGNRIDLQVTNENMGGDPAVGEDKTLTVLYSVNGRREQAVVREGDYLRLSGSGSGGGSGGYGTLIPRGTELKIRTNERIESKDTYSGQTYSATLEEDVRDASGRVAIPRRSDVALVIRNTSNKELVLDIDSLMVGGERYYVSTEDVQRGRRSGGRTAKMVGGGAIAGAVIGAILGGGKGAAIGAGVGAGAGAVGSVLTGGKEVKVPAETVLTFRLDQDLQLGY